MSDQLTEAQTRFEQVPLGDVVTLHYGKALPKNERDKSGPVPVYGANGIKDRTNQSLTEGPSLIVGRKGSAGEITRVEGQFWPLDVTYFTSHDSRRVDFNYLEYALSLLDLPSLARGVKPGINRNDVYALSVPLPPLDKQKRIVGVLDQAFAALDRARAHAEANLADAEHMAEIFLDEQIISLSKDFGRIRIGALAKVKGGKRLPKGEKPGIEKTPYPYITVREMNDTGTISSEKVGFISEAAQSTIKRYTISSADIYISIAGTIGKTGVVPERLNGANLTENAAKLVLSNGWLRDFVYWSTRSSDFRTQMIEQTRTAAQPKLALQRLGAITIPNADPQSQSRIVENMVRFRDEVGVLKSAYEAKLADIADLRQSLLQKAFSGQLT